MMNVLVNHGLYSYLRVLLSARKLQTIWGICNRQNDRQPPIDAMRFSKQDKRDKNCCLYGIEANRIESIHATNYDDDDDADCVSLSGMLWEFESSTMLVAASGHL